eukprot:CAMPEP_0118927398 /NCGR_PEP_ID=MMETSP1169-20130426/4877_1 /TAXON_ID=36882 /ORGANISM="Pyramimonas obovata, Strain CCMP722" /LENGTH=473 /DNA_ID=CAMNT_0006869145 /DNA_START=407 /DNA_END=1828 /DNA_ORIENTATION=+
MTGGTAHRCFVVSLLLWVRVGTLLLLLFASKPTAAVRRECISDLLDLWDSCEAELSSKLAAEKAACGLPKYTKTKVEATPLSPECCNNLVVYSNKTCLCSREVISLLPELAPRDGGAGSFLKLMSMAASPLECDIASYRMLSFTSGKCMRVDADQLTQQDGGVCGGLDDSGDGDVIATAAPDKASQPRSVFESNGAISKGWYVRACRGATLGIGWVQSEGIEQFVLHTRLVNGSVLALSNFPDGFAVGPGAFLHLGVQADNSWLIGNLVIEVIKQSSLELEEAAYPSVQLMCNQTEPLNSTAVFKFRHSYLEPGRKTDISVPLTVYSEKEGATAHQLALRYEVSNYSGNVVGDEPSLTVLLSSITFSTSSDEPSTGNVGVQVVNSQDLNKVCEQLASLVRTAVAQCPGANFDWCAPTCMTILESLSLFAESKRVLLDQCAATLLSVKGSVGLLQSLNKLETCRTKDNKASASP